MALFKHDFFRPFFAGFLVTTLAISAPFAMQAMAGA